MKYAIIQTGGKQYKVSEGQEILIDRLNGQKSEAILFSDILLIRTDEETLIGNPYVVGGSVKGKVIGEVKGEKVTVSKFKAKVHYRRKIGFRHSLSKVKIESIDIGQAKPKEKKTSKSSV